MLNSGETCNPLELLKEGGIPKTLLFQSKVDIDHLTCPICFNILWKPVACAQDRCFQSFCEVCINRWIKESQNSQMEQVMEPQLQVFQGSLYSQSLIVAPPVGPNYRVQSYMGLGGSTFQTSSTPHMERSGSSYSSSENVSENGNETFDQEWPQNSYRESHILSEPLVEPKCPKCKRVFKKTSIPIIHNLLEAIQLHCIHEGCKIKPGYEQFQKHIMICQYRKINCSGCLEVFFQSQIQQHQTECELVQVQCEQCQATMTRRELKDKHSRDNKDHQIQQLQSQIELLTSKNVQLEGKIEKMMKCDFESLSLYTFKTSFTTNYSFINNNGAEAKLIRSSYNQQKQKNDFLHFYINHKIRTQSIFGLQWKIKILTLQGNLLLGICSTLCHYSIDFIINRLGEIKKKEWNENKYKHLRKVNFTFGEGDVLVFQFKPFQQTLRIMNETRHLICRFESSEMIEMGESFFSFFSLETQGDTLQFL